MTQQWYAPPRAQLSRVIAVINGKGGVGKTSVTSHLAGLLAQQVEPTGGRVLIVDLDKQGNVGDDLGYNARGQSDGGAGISEAVQFGRRPSLILRDVRPGLDVAPGGLEGRGQRNHIEELSAALGSRASTGEEGRLAATLSLAHALAPIAGDYHAVFIDCPPGFEPLQRAALGAAAYAFIPTKTDLSSRKGLTAVAARYGDVLPDNPELQLLGVVLFGVTTSAKVARQEAREWIEAGLGGQAPVFKTVVRQAEVVAKRIRDRGQLAFELVLGAEEGATPAEAKAAVGLSKDYAGVAKEFNTRLMELEAAATGAGA